MSVTPRAAEDVATRRPWGWASRPTRAWLPALVPALAAVALHLPSVRFGFVRDDFPLIVENPMMREPGMLGRLLTSDFLASAGLTGGLWRPLVLLSFWLEGRLGSWSPGLFHATNVALYGGATLALGLLLLQSGVPSWAALAGALWFAVMPAHMEPVDWILGRTDLMCGGSALVSLWLDRRARAAQRAWPGVWALAAFAGALLSKEAAAGWAAVIAAAELARSSHTRVRAREVARWIAPYLAVTVLWLIAHTLAAGHTELPAYVDAELLARRRAAAALMLPQYLAFLWPWYPHSSDVAAWLPAHWNTVPVLAGGVFLLAGVALAAALAWRRSRWMVPCAIVAVAVLPSLALALAKGYITSGERMVFLSSAGIAWFAALALAWAMERQRLWRGVAIAAAAVVIGGSVVETLRVQPTWADDASVFRTMTARQPDNPIGWVGLADVLARAGQGADALSALARAQTLAPQLPAVAVGAARVRYQHGDWEGTIADADRALVLEDASFEARLLRASALVRLRRTSEAATDIERLLSDRPGDPSALQLEGQRLMADGLPAQAVVPLARAASAQPGNPPLWMALGNAQAAAGDLNAARTAFEHALELTPDDLRGWRTLARVCVAMGDTAAAQAAMERASAIPAGASRTDAPSGAGAPDGGPR